MKKTLLTMAALSTLAMAEEGFDLAPTPVSQTQVKTGDVERMTRLSYFNASVGDYELNGVGVQAARKDGIQTGATNFSGSLLTLSGSGNDLDTTLVGANLAYLWESYLPTAGDSTMTLFYGGDFSYMFMNAYNDNYEIDTYTTLYGGTLGLQYNIHTPKLIISPFGVAKYLMGSYEAKIWANSYTTRSDTIDPVFSQAFGFDVYFKSLGSTLSAMVKQDGESSSTMLSYAWFW